MERVSIYYDDVVKAIDACKKNHMIIGCTKLEPNENIHYIDGKFYYEDGCVISTSRLGAIEFLKKQFWAQDAKWYAVRQMDNDDIIRLRNIHKQYSGALSNAFNKSYNQFINVTEG